MASTVLLRDRTELQSRSDWPSVRSKSVEPVLTATSRKMAQEMSWLNKSFVEKVLRKSEGDNSIRVTDIFTKLATNKGDNYASEMVRVTVEYSRRHGDQEITEKKPIIVKISPLVEAHKDLVMKAGLFDTEISMMSDTLDRMNKLLGPENRLSAKCLYIQKEPLLLVLEDLAPHGFSMADRQAGLDLAHCVLAIRGLARFHASSIAVCEQDPSQKDKYHLGMFNEKYAPDNLFHRYFISAFNNVVKQVPKCPELARYSEKLSRLAPKINQVGIDAYKLDKDEFNVINHGDYWVNNMMFKYNDKGKPIGHISVDFQICVYGSPAIDLLLFLNTCPSVEVIENNEDLLLDQYLGTLTTTMKELGCKKRPLIMEELKNIMKRRARLGMIVFFTMYPIILYDNKDDLLEIEDLTSGKDNPAFKGKLFREIMIKRLPLYDQLGLLDV